MRIAVHMLLFIIIHLRLEIIYHSYPYSQMTQNVFSLTKLSKIEGLICFCFDKTPTCSIYITRSQQQKSRFSLAEHCYGFKRGGGARNVFRHHIEYYS